MKKILIPLLAFLIAFGIYFLFTVYKQAPGDQNVSGGVIILDEGDVGIERNSDVLQAQRDAEPEMAFSNINLKTNTAISSIPLANVLGGGPAKDGIPAITEPGFVSVQAAEEWLDDEGLGIIYVDGEMVRYYPYAILYRHEIVNDQVNGKNIAVTFCPLCGSALIFDRGEDVFGVSGKLWESNLLMYDEQTESLWSQIRGEAVVGDRTGEVLEVLDANIITFAEVKKAYPEAEILSNDTGYDRDYGVTPYGDYETNDALYFDVSDENEAFSKKELFYVVHVDEDFMAGFMRADLLVAGEAEVEHGGQVIRAQVDEDGIITVTNVSTNEQLPGLITMWFSWVTHFEKERVVWSL